MHKKYSDRFTPYIEKCVHLIECIDFQKIHRVFFVCVSISFAFLLVVNIIATTNKDSQQIPVSSKNASFHLPVGEYRIISANIFKEDPAVLLVAPLHGGALMAAKPEDGSIPSTVLENCSNYRLKISEQGSWMFYAYQEDAHYGHPDIPSEKEAGESPS